MMPINKPLTLNVRIGGALSDFVSANVDENGNYENVSEYVRDLIRRDEERVEAEQLSVQTSSTSLRFAV